MKSKISKTKRNNQKKNKLIKQGVIKKAKQPSKNSQNGFLSVKKTNTAEKDDDSDQGEDLLDMVEQDDMDFLKSAITSRSYNMYNKIKLTQSAGPKPKKRKVMDDESLEKNFEEQLVVNENDKQIKNLLPIKTKTGIIQQHQVLEQTEENEDEEQDEEISDKEQSNDDDTYSFLNSGIDLLEPVSALQLLAKRNEVINKAKIHIGTLSAGLLENPEEKMTNLKTLLSMMEEEVAEIYVSIKKLLVVSLLEVFKDILPSYEIKNIDTDGVKLKKDTLKIKKYEENMLLYYKKFLQKLEKYAFVLFKKKGDTRKRSEEELKLAALSIQAMCDLLKTHTYFNFSQNIAQALIPFLNNHNKNIRELVKTSVQTIFKEDKKEEITLKILKIINHYLKNHSHIHVELLEVLLVLKLKDLDVEKEQDMKQKKLMHHKSRILQLSRMEKKRKKKLQEVEKELLETKAQENRQAKEKNLTEITKIVFNIYFRILKNSNDSKVLSVCLEGLAKYAHCINIEFYVDIVNVLDNLLNEEWLEYKEQLYCIQTVFAILSGQGDALNLDPLRFYNSLYKILLTLNCSKKSKDMLILIKTLTEALIKRRKKITNKRILGFIKRLAQLSLQVTHGGSLSCLGIIKNIMQLNRSTDILLDLDPTAGEGQYSAEIDDPEYSNASSTALYEMILLRKHFHPIVNKFAINIANGVPSSGEGSLPGEYAKSTPEQLCIEFDMSEMAFNPAVPPPKKENPKGRSKQVFANSSFEEECRNVLRQPMETSLWL